MASVNKVILVGNLGADPEIRYMESGDAVTNIRIATTDRYKDKQSGEMKELTEWHRIAFFGKLADIAGQYLRKGSQVYIEGRLRTRKWQDQSGQDKYSTDVIAETMQMLGSRQGAHQGPDEAGDSNRNASRHRTQRADSREAGYGGGERQQSQGQTQERRQPAPSNGFEDMDDDIPF